MGLKTKCPKCGEVFFVGPEEMGIGLETLDDACERHRGEWEGLFDEKKFLELLIKYLSEDLHRKKWEFIDKCPKCGIEIKNIVYMSSA